MRNRDGVEYNTEIVLIVKRNHSTTLAQPSVPQRKGFLESRRRDKIDEGCQGLEKSRQRCLLAVDYLKTGPGN